MTDEMSSLVTDHTENFSLDIEGIGLRFGGLTALDDITFSVPSGEICAIIGPNGAGKTSLFNVLTTLYKPQSGRATFNGVDLLNCRRSELAGYGISRTFQNLALFESLTVLDNVLLGAHSHQTGGFLDAVVRSGRMRKSETQARANCLDILDRLGISNVKDSYAKELSYGTLKRVELARALASRPKLLLLDEPAAGLHHAEVDELSETIRTIRDDHDLTIVVVEHHMALVMALADTVVALNFGTMLAQGGPQEVASNPEVIRAYLGSAA